jgi:hypothetical protein
LNQKRSSWFPALPLGSLPPGQIELQIRSLFPPCGNSQGNPQPEFNLRQNESLDDAKQNRLEI